AADRYPRLTYFIGTTGECEELDAAARLASPSQARTVARGRLDALARREADPIHRVIHVGRGLAYAHNRAGDAQSPNASVDFVAEQQPAEGHEGQSHDEQHQLLSSREEIKHEWRASGAAVSTAELRAFCTG